MAFEFNLPDIGEGVTEGEIVSWLIQKGDTVTEDQPIVEVMTDKATVEIASPKNGTIEDILGAEGDTIEVGKPLVLINEGASATTSTSEPKNEETSATPAPQTADNVTAMPASKPAALAPTAAHVLAAPITRKTAREMGIDINAVAGSGPLGRITMDDVKNAATGKINMPVPSPVASTPAPAASQETSTFSIPQRQVTTAHTETRIPVKGIRKKIVENMRKSLDHAAHFSHMDELDATNMVAARTRLKEKAAEYGVKLNYLPFVVKALVEALKLYPRLNASFDEVTNEIIEKGYYNIGVAVATKNEDLVVPVIHNADQKGLLQIASEIKELAGKAQNNKLSPDDFADGTFTVTSLGAFAGTYATPIINYPEMGILGFYKIEPRAVVRDGEIVARQMANISFSIDHRIVDGYLGAKFSKAFIEFLEKPEMLLMF